MARLEFALKLADVLNRTSLEPLRVHLKNYPEEITELHIAVLASSLPSITCTGVSLQCRRFDEEADTDSNCLYWESEKRTDDEWFDLFVRSRPLPLGDVAVVPECLFSSQTRVSSHAAADLDVSQWIGELRNISAKDLIADLGRKLTVEYKTIPDQVPIGATLSEFIEEGQSSECKFPLECTIKNLPTWPRKMLNTEFITVLNRAKANEVVELWLGVREQSLLMLGAAFEDPEYAFEESLNVFPPVTNMLVEIYRVAPPLPGKYYVKWFDSQEQAWEWVTSLKGRGWLLPADDKVGVVVCEEDRASTDEELDRRLLADVQFNRSILRVKVQSLYPRTYINKDIRFGKSLQMYPFEVWLRLHSAERSTFFERFSFFKSLSIRMMFQGDVGSFPAKFLLPRDRNKIVDALFEQNVKDRYALIDVECVEELEKLIRFDRKENLCEEIPGSTLTKWYVGLVASDLPNIGGTQSVLYERMQNAVRKLHDLKGVRVEEIKFSMGNSLEALVLGNRMSYQGISYDHGSMDVVNEVLVDPDELGDDLKRMAKSWICPEDDRDKGEPSWALVKAGYIIRTEYVDQVVSSIDALLSDASYTPKHRVVRVFSRFPGNGLTSVLRLAAWICGVGNHRATANNTVLFLNDVHDEEKVSKTIEKFAEKSPVVIFCDRGVSTAWLVQRFSENPACVLVLGSRSESEFDDVTIRSEWSAECLKKLCGCLEKLPFRHPQEVISKALATALDEVSASGEGPFYVFPWVASMGRYVPVRDCIRQQVEKGAQLNYSSILDSLAFFSLTLRKELLDNVTFAEVLNDSDFPLLVRTRRRGNYTYRFVHSEMAFTHLSFVGDRDWKVSSPDESNFPANVCAMWTESIADVITHLGHPLQTQVTEEIAYDPEDCSDFTPFIRFVISQPREQTFLDSFVSVSDKVRIPVVDRLILMTRMEGARGDFDRRLELARDAFEKARRTANELKARNNLAQSLAELAIATTRDLDRREQLWSEAIGHFDLLWRKLDTDEKRKSLAAQITKNTRQFESSSRPMKQSQRMPRKEKRGSQAVHGASPSLEVMGGLHSQDKVTGQ